MTAKKPNLKILFQGESGVGKSSLLQRFTLDVFDEHIASTIGVDFRLKPISLPHPTKEGQRLQVNVQLFDTAGQERFKSLSTSYYRDGAAALFVYDATNKELTAQAKQLKKVLRGMINVRLEK